MSAPKVLFIVGKGRSGSTVLDNVLNGIEGWFGAGELFRRFGAKPMASYPCGCGLPASRCEVWARTFKRARAKASQALGREIGVEEPLHWEREVLGTSDERWNRELWTQAIRLERTSPGAVSGWPALASLVTYQRHLYEALGEGTGARVIVDSSKWPVAPGPLGLVPGLEAFVLHLVRDPRAVAFSWTRTRRFSPGGPEMPRFGPAHSSLSWLARNSLADRICRARGPRGRRLLYEDLIRRPRQVIRDLASWLGEPSDHPLPFQSERTVRLDRNHSLGGNPNRFTTGEILLREDDEWRRALPAASRRVVTLVTAPLLLRYGYPLR